MRVFAIYKLHNDYFFICEIYTMRVLKCNIRCLIPLSPPTAVWDINPSPLDDTPLIHYFLYVPSTFLSILQVDANIWFRIPALLMPCSRIYACVCTHTSYGSSCANSIWIIAVWFSETYVFLLAKSGRNTFRRRISFSLQKKHTC